MIELAMINLVLLFASIVLHGALIFSLLALLHAVKPVVAEGAVAVMFE